MKKTPLNRVSKNKVKKVKAHNASWWKKKADNLMSLYVRQKSANSEGMCYCYTCGAYKHWKEIQNGHFVSRSYLSTRYLQENTRVQCWGCNGYGNGQTMIFANNLENENPGIVAKLYKKAAEIKPMRVADYQAICKYYEDLLVLFI